MVEYDEEGNLIDSEDEAPVSFLDYLVYNNRLILPSIKASDVERKDQGETT